MERPGSARSGRGGPLILVLDDDLDSVISLSHMLRDGGYRTGMAGDRAKALALVAELPVALIVSDLWMPDGDGLSFIKAARAIKPGLPAILVTAHGDWDTCMEALRDGVADYLTKPVRKAELLALVSRALEDFPSRRQVSPSETLPLER